MVYIKLNTPVNGCDMIRIKEYHFFDSNDRSITPISIGFRYQCCRKEEEKYIESYNKFMTIEDESFSSKFFSSLNNNMDNLYDNICIILLNYLISKKIEIGTLEVK